MKQEKKKQKAEYELPLHRFEKVQKIGVDPLAICSIVLAAVLMLALYRPMRRAMETAALGYIHPEE